MAGWRVDRDIPWTVARLADALHSGRFPAAIVPKSLSIDPNNRRVKCQLQLIHHPVGTLRVVCRSGATAICVMNLAFVFVDIT